MSIGRRKASEEKEEAGGFFVLPAEKAEDGGGVLRSSGSEDRRWGVLRFWEPEDRGTPPSSKNPRHLRRNPPRLPSDLRTDLQGRRSKIEDGGVLRSSAPKIEDACQVSGISFLNSGWPGPGAYTYLNQ